MQSQIPIPSQRPESNQKIHEKLDKILDILQDQQVEGTKTKRVVTNPGLKQAPLATHPPTSSWATVASSNDNQWQTVHRARAPPSAPPVLPKPQAPSYLERSLVITVKDKTKTFDPRMTRNAINQKLQAKGFNDPVVATVNKSRSGESVIITTMPKYKNDVLIEHKDQWESIVDTVNVTKDARWARIIAHGINIETFSGDQGMQLLRSEIEIFNPGLVLAQHPLWLTKEEARINKRYSSVILTTKSQKDANIAMKQGLCIAGNRVQVTEYTTYKPTDQCDKCQQFGHWSRKCTSNAKCQYCGNSHSTKEHKCHVCRAVGRSCDHTVAKCANCQGPHWANNPAYETYRAIHAVKNSVNDELGHSHV